VPRAEFDVETSLPPERVRQLLLDFSERRPDVWPALERSLYEVYSVGETTAEVKEGSKMPGMTIWARELYEFSDPSVVRWSAIESNFCTPGSGVVVALHPREGGGTRVRVEWQRVGTTFKGRAVIRLIALTGGRPVASYLKKTFQTFEQDEAARSTAA
jgi:hypothetical protein